LAEQAKILVAEAEENNLGAKAIHSRFQRWYTCGLCEQEYHGVVRCALGWACWKTYLSRPETDWTWQSAMTQLGNGLYIANQYEDAVSVQEAMLSVYLRIGGSENNMLVAQGNLSITYQMVGRQEDSLRMRQDVYSGRLKLHGEEHPETARMANNYATSLLKLQRFGEVKSLLCRTLPVTRRVLGKNSTTTLASESIYAEALYGDPSATLRDLREAVTTLEDAERTARRVFGGAHPTTVGLGAELKLSRAALRAREAPSTSG